MTRRGELDLANLAQVAGAMAELTHRPVLLVHRIEPRAEEQLAGAELERARTARLRTRAHYRVNPEASEEKTS